jgi:hypothetical protein
MTDNTRTYLQELAEWRFGCDIEALLQGLVNDGRTSEQISDAFKREGVRVSPSGVRHWITRFGIERGRAPIVLPKRETA